MTREETIRLQRGSTLRLSALCHQTMSIYEEIEIEDMEYDAEDYSYSYPCPCGDRFRITLEELWDGEDIAKCPSCTLRIMVIFEEEDLPELPPEEDDDESTTGLESQVKALAVK